MLKRERVALEKEKELMEKEKVKLRQSEQKFKAEVSERNKTFFEREQSIRKNEDKLLKLALQNSEKESRLRREKLDFLIQEAKQREVHEKEEARIASEKLELSKEREADAKRFQKENEILAVRENNQQRKEDEFRNDNKIFSSASEDKNESRLTSREKGKSKGKRKTAARKGLKKEKKAKETMTDDHEWVLERAFFLVTFPWKV